MIYIIADDLTGASDTGVQYKRRGLRTLISTEIDLPFLDERRECFDVISINADTRTKLPHYAYRITYELVKHIHDCRHKYIYKKVDSLARGNAAQELEAVMDATEASLALISISYPANQRTLKNGIIELQEQNGSRSEVNVTELFSNGMSRMVQGISLETVRSGKIAVQGEIALGMRNGAQVFVLDAITNEDLEVIRDVAMEQSERVVLCGSAGLADRLSLLETGEKDENLGRKDQPVAVSGAGAEEIILVMIGSRNACTAEQIKALSKTREMPVLIVATSEILEGEGNLVREELLRSAGELIGGGCRLFAVVVDALFEDFEFSLNDSPRNISASLKIAEFMGNLAKVLGERYSVGTILSSGGDTSLAVLKAFEAKGIDLDSEILPGVPVGRLIGGSAEGMTIITKSGGFGQADSLIRSIDFLERKDRKKGNL